MYRVDHVTGSTVLPAPMPATATPDRYFQGGDSTTGTLATVVEAEFLNMLQEEGANLVLSAGLVLNKADRTQWTQAVDAKVAAGGIGTFVRITGDTMSGPLFNDSGRIVSRAAGASLGLVVPGVNASAFWSTIGTDIQFGSADGNGVPDAAWGYLDAATLRHSAVLSSPSIRAHTNGGWDGSTLCIGADPANDWKFYTNTSGDMKLQATLGGVSSQVWTFSAAGTLYVPDVVRIGAQRDQWFYLQNNATLAMKSIVFADPGIGGSISYQEALDAIDVAIIPNQVLTRSDNNGFLSLGAYNTAGNAYINWSVASSQEFKTDIADYLVGLEDICKLRPISFKYNDQLPAPFHDDGSVKVGLIAEEAELVWPTLVGTMKLGVSNVPLVQQDIKVLSFHEVNFAMVNAFKEIKARLEALEGGALRR